MSTLFEQSVSPQVVQDPPEPIESADPAVPLPRTPPARRGGRVGLTRQVVLAEAARLADEIGDARVPLATVADRLGVRLPSLYKHVAGVDGMRRGVARLAAEGLRDTLAARATAPARPVGDSRAQSGSSSADEADEADELSTVARLSHAYREWALTHPGLHAALLDRPHPEDPEHVSAVAAVNEVFLGVAQGCGASDDVAAVDAARVVRGALHGFCALEIAGCLGGRSGVDRSFARVVDVLDAAVGPRRPSTGADRAGSGAR